MMPLFICGDLKCLELQYLAINIFVALGHWQKFIHTKSKYMKYSHDLIGWRTVYGSYTMYEYHQYKSTVKIMVWLTMKNHVDKSFRHVGQ